AAPRQPDAEHPSESTSDTPRALGTGRGGATSSPSSSRGRPVQRLQSLKKRTPGGSPVPLNPDGTAPKPTLKYQPKFVARKSKEERDDIERLEAERHQQRISEAAATRKSSRGSGRARARGRGRGAYGAGDRSGVGGPLGASVSTRGSRW